ncbi:Structural maintenance of chromosomes protein 5, partial [Coemansia guatemalensis]
MPPVTHLEGNTKRAETPRTQTKHSKVEPRATRSKRRRAASSVSPENSEEDEANEEDEEDSTMAMKALRIGAEGTHNLQDYRPGSITRIQLHNFVTYDHMEVQPGPHMNMIIGPNGTGKSTIVCAIALGLGERPSVLGRAKDISEFVKHGHERGSIEITLAGRQPGGGELTIQREIIREGNKSTWRVNGRQTSLSEVQKAIRELDIQVGNLCQFLPQDRVVEFSKMSAQDLLKETQRAVGRGDLLEQQQQLAALRLKETQTMSEMRRVAQDTETLRKQNDVLERDVQRWQERQAAESQLRVLTALLPVIRYIEAKAEHDRTKDARRQAHAHYLEAKNASGPAEEEIQELETRIAQSDGNR